MDETRNRISMLERTILDLGTQLYELKGSFDKLREESQNLKSEVLILKNSIVQDDLSIDEEIYEKAGRTPTEDSSNSKEALDTSRKDHKQKH